MPFHLKNSIHSTDYLSKAVHIHICASAQMAQQMIVKVQAVATRMETACKEWDTHVASLYSHTVELERLAEIQAGSMVVKLQELQTPGTKSHCCRFPITHEGS